MRQPLYGYCKSCGKEATGSYYRGSSGYCYSCYQNMEKARYSAKIEKIKKFKSEGLSPADLKALGFSSEDIKRAWE